MSRYARSPWIPTLIAVLAASLAGGCAQEAAPPEESFPEVQYDTIEASLAELETELDVQLALYDNFGVDGMRVESEVVGSRVILGGTVHDPATQELAGGVVASLTGVEDVDNRIVVAPSEDFAAEDDTTAEAQQELADATLEARIKLALFGAVGLDAAQLEIEAVNGTVSVGGELSSEESKAAALAAVDATEGVTQVIDMVQVAQPVVTEQAS
jgi:osmotically-inducible protein OsmY